MKDTNRKREPDLSLSGDDFVWQTMTSGGPGGQNQNKVFTGVRLLHPDSGVTVESREERSQYANKRRCLEKLAKNPKFLLWAKLKLSGQEDIEAKVDEMMNPENIVIETINDDGKWEKLDKKENL